MDNKDAERCEYCKFNKKPSLIKQRMCKLCEYGLIGIHDSDVDEDFEYYEDDLYND